MIFTDAIFLWFFAACFSVYWLLRRNSHRKHWLLVSSYFFYGAWDYRFLGLIFATTLLDFVAGIWIEAGDARRKRLWLVASLCANLGVLGWFKYYDFFVVAGSDMLQLFGIPVAPRTLGLILPVGISFFTFQSMSYTIDVYRGEIRANRSFVDFALFVSFFPQLVAGPIVRAREFLPQLDERRSWADVQGRRMLLLFLSGYVKKACIADNIARVIDPVFADPTASTSGSLVLASLLYSVQIYCDFSGYSDMAIGTAGMLGYRLPKNFDFPYFARNVQDLWRRWHMSFSTWLRDYLYVPLGGGRGSRASTLRNLAITMLLGGLWHGANWTFVLWGALHGMALVVHRLWLDLVGSSLPPRAQRSALVQLGASSYGLASILLTFAWTAGCFTLFRCPTIGIARDYFATMWSGRSEVAIDADWWVAFALLALTHAVVHLGGAGLLRRAERAPGPLFYSAYGAVFGLLPLLRPMNTEPFIYFQF